MMTAVGAGPLAAQSQTVDTTNWRVQVYDARFSPAPPTALIPWNAFLTTAPTGTQDNGALKTLRNLQLEGTAQLAEYRGVTLAGVGVPMVVATLDTVARDSVPTRTVLRTGTSPGAGIYSSTVVLFVDSAGTGGGWIATVRCNNGAGATVDSTSRLVDSTGATLGSKVAASLACYSVASDSVVFKVSRSGTVTGSPKYDVHFILKYGE